MVSSFRQLEIVCKALGLQCKQTKKGRLWTGVINGSLVRIAVHPHVEGDDVASGTFNKYVKQLGFKSEKGYFDFLNKL
ncbi:MAG: hypothetical protein ACYCYE_07240 [Clostridia bacterium]